MFLSTTLILDGGFKNYSPGISAVASMNQFDIITKYNEQNNGFVRDIYTYKHGAFR